MDQSVVKGFLKKFKDSDPFKSVYDKIEADFKGKFPCCQPLDTKYCNLFFELLWNDEKAKNDIAQTWHGTIEYKNNGSLRKIYL